MKLTKKQEKQLLEKVRSIKALEAQKKEIESEIDGFKDDIKAYMDKNKTSELNVDIFTVHYTETETERFDSKALQKADEELYKKVPQKEYFKTLFDYMMSDYEKAVYIAGIVSRWAKNRECITAKKVLEKCASQQELNWWYSKIRSIEN